MEFSFSVWPSNARFLLQLNTVHFNFRLWAITLLDEKDANLLEQHCPIQALSISISKVHAAEHLLHSSAVLQELHLLRYEV